jgi:hypothetical protein
MFDFEDHYVPFFCKSAFAKVGEALDRRKKTCIRFALIIFPILNITCFYTGMTLCVIVLILHRHFNSFLPHEVALQNDPLTQPTL